MLSIKNLCKTYKAKGGVEVHALDNVSIDFAETGMVFLLGKSGSGKSTLLNVIGGLDKCDSGEIVICGRNSKTFTGSDFDSYRNTFIGFIFQEYNILNEFNIEDNIALALQLQGRKNDSEQVEKILEQVDMAGMGKRRANTLSGGQKQRVAIARALVKNPQIIMADEPTGALDSETGKQIFSTLKKLSKEKLVIVVSHDREFAMQYGDRIIELADGKVISDLSRSGENEYVDTNVVIHDDNFVTIKDPASLTDEDKNTLFDLLKKKKGQVLISTGDNNVNKIKSSFDIDEKSGGRGTFEKTNDVVMKEYGEEDSKLIRSHLPFNRSLKIGASNLKIKPFRLVMTILLSTITFTLFGSASSLMLIDKSYAVRNSLKKTNYGSEVLQKSFRTEEESISFDPITNLISDRYKYEGQLDDYFTKEEVEELNEKSGMKCYGILSSAPGSYGNENICVEGDTSIGGVGDIPYYKGTNLKGAVVMNDSDLKDLGFTIIEGRLPMKEDEVAITKFTFDSIKETHENITSLESFETYRIECNLNNDGWLEYYNVVGIIDTGDIPEKYDALKSPKEMSKLTATKADSLKNEYEDYLEASFQNIIFATKDIEKYYINSYSPFGVYDYFEFYNANGMALSGCDEIFDYATDYSSVRILTENYYVNMPNSFVFFDENEEIVPYKKLNENEVYLNQGYLMIQKGERAGALTEKLENILYSDSYFLVPTNKRLEFEKKYGAIDEYPLDEKFTEYRAGLLKEEEKEDFENLVKDIYRFNYLYELSYTFEYYCNETGYTDDEYLRIIKNCENSFRYTEEYYDDLESYFNNCAEFQKVYENYYYYKVSKALCENNIYFSCNYEDFLCRNTSTSQSMYYGTTKAGKEYIEKTKELYKKMEYCTYVFFDKTFNVANPFEYLEQTFYPKQIYVSHSNGDNNTLDVVGYYNLRNYYETNCAVDYDFTPMFSNEYLEKYYSYGGSNVYFNQKTSNYTISKDGVYSEVIVASDYSSEQVGWMIKNYGEYWYAPLNSAYEEINYFLNTASVLNIVFLISGAVFGILACLLFWNFISTSINNKAKEIGILRAVGARGSDLQKIFFSETGIITLICFTLSCILSAVVVRALDSSLGEFLPVSILQFNYLNILIVLGVSLVVGFVSTFFPVLKHSKKPPVDAIRSL